MEQSRSGLRRSSLHKKESESGTGLRVEDFGIVAVAIDALRGSIFVDDDGLFGNKFGLGMAFGAGNIRMAAGEDEVSAGIVIEGGRNPALSVVAIDAVGLAVFSDKLRIVSVNVAGFALLGSAFRSAIPHNWWWLCGNRHRLRYDARRVDGTWSWNDRSR